MVELAGKQTSPTVNRVASALDGRNRVSSHFDDLLKSPKEPSKQRLANELATELWSRLPISRVADASGDRGIEHTIRIVTASTSQVQAWYRELAEFVPAIAEAATEFRNDGLTNELRSALIADIQKQLLENIRYPLPSRSFVDFTFADLPSETAWTEANRRLEQACIDFANRVFALFDTLQEKIVVGGIQETSSTCRFTFFRRVAILSNAPAKTEKRIRRDPDFQILGHTVYLHETLQISDIDIQHRHAQFVHHVRNPVLNCANATEHPLPEKYRELIDCCPDWMAGSLRVLEGELFREEHIEWDLHSETRTQERVIERVRRCPAVVFGPYILAGWGETAIREEVKRQDNEQTDCMKKASAKQAQRLQFLSFFVGGLAIAMIFLTRSATAATTSLAILTGLAAMALAGIAAHKTLYSHSKVTAGRVLIQSTLIGASVFAAQGLLFSILHWSLPAFGVAILAAVIAAIAFNVKSAVTELSRFSVR